MDKYEFRLYWSVVDTYTILTSGMTHDIARGLDDQRVGVLLYEMFQNEQLLCFPYSDPKRSKDHAESDSYIEADLFTRLNETKCFKPTLERVMLALGSRRRLENAQLVNADETWEDTLVYGLGPRGAPRWEEVANPRWGLFIERNEEPIEGDPSRQIITLRGQRERLEQALLLLPHMKVVPGSERWEHFSPWPATYWKTLPQGANVTFEAQGDFTMKHPHTMEEETWYEFEQWYTVPDEFKQPGYWH